MAPVKETKPISSDLKKLEWATNPYSQKFGDRDASQPDGNPTLMKRARTEEQSDQPKADKSDGRPSAVNLPLDVSQVPAVPDHTRHEHVPLDDSQAPDLEPDTSDSEVTWILGQYWN